MSEQETRQLYFGGDICTFDGSLPRNRAAIRLWVRTLERFLRAHESDDALLNRTFVLP